MMTRSREDLLRQFSAADGHNPLADFKAARSLAEPQTRDRQNENLRAMLEKMAALEKELQGLRDERQKQLELSEVEDKGTAKGRTFEEAVFTRRSTRSPRRRATTATPSATSRAPPARPATSWSGSTRARRPARGRIVFEAKNRQLTRPKALAELGEALAERDAQFAVLVVPTEEKVPARLAPMREYNGDKLIVTYDPEDGSRLALEVAYSLARARVLMARGEEPRD